MYVNCQWFHLWVAFFCVCNIIGSAKVVTKRMVVYELCEEHLSVFNVNRGP